MQVQTTICYEIIPDFNITFYYLLFYIISFYLETQGGGLSVARNDGV